MRIQPYTQAKTCGGPGTGVLLSTVVIHLRQLVSVEYDRNDDIETCAAFGLVVRFDRTVVLFGDSLNESHSDTVLTVRTLGETLKEVIDDFRRDARAVVRDLKDNIRAGFIEFAAECNRGFAVS